MNQKLQSVSPRERANERNRFVPSPSGPSRSAERLLLAPRTLVGISIVILAGAQRSLWTPGVVIVGVWYVLTSVASWRALSRRADDGARSANSLSGATLLADTLGALALLILLGPIPNSPALLLFPLIFFEASLTYGRRGVGIGLVGLTIALGARIAVRTVGYGLAPRYALLLLVLAASAAFLGVGLALRSKEQMCIGALEEKERIAASLRATVMELLATAGRNPDGLECAELSVLLDAACQTAEVAPELAQHVAAALSTEPSSSLPSPRETQVLELLCQGFSDREIAEHLYLSAGTIRVHISNAAKRLKVANRQEAIRAYRALRDGHTRTPSA